MYRNLIKPTFDFLAALLGFIVLSPVFILVTVALFFVNDGKPFFFQRRPGKNEKIFRIIKFKTMNDKTDSQGNLLHDNERLTFIGKIVRKTSLDELPQLLNVIKGDMSLIGPRPLLPEYLGLFSAHHARRHEVRPGITGLAQIKGRNNMLFSERFNWDVYYVDHLSPMLDIQILFSTVKNVIFKSSSVQNGQTVDEVDDLGISKNLSANHFKKKEL